MQSHAHVARHPLHPMLVMFPTAMFPLLLLLDVLYLWRGDDLFWTAGFWIAVVGVVTTIAAAIPGIVDLSAIPNESRAHRTALYHLTVGTITLVAYAAAVWARWPAGSILDSTTLAIAIDVVGVLLITAQGWLGGELVYKHHIGVLTTREGGDPTPLERGGRAVDSDDEPSPGPAVRRV